MAKHNLKSKTSKSARQYPTKTKAAQSAFTCTLEQETAAHRFLTRTIEVQRIVGACGDGCGFGFLSEINEAYHSTIERLLSDEGRHIRVENPPLTFTIRDSDSGVLFHIQDVMRNGALSDQATAKDFLFAVHVRQAIAYEVQRVGKSRYALLAYLSEHASGSDMCDDYRQTIEVSQRGFEDLFRCPYCTEYTDTLYASYFSMTFGCVPCHTILNSQEFERYQRTVKAEKAAGKGSAA